MATDIIYTGSSESPTPPDGYLSSRAVAVDGVVYFMISRQVYFHDVTSSITLHSLEEVEVLEKAISAIKQHMAQNG